MAQALIIWAAPSRVNAEEESLPVVVDVEPCVHYEQERVVHLLRVDLGERFASAFSAGTLELQVTCRTGGALVRARRGGHGQAIRSLSAEEIGGDVGARVLSLKAIELLREVMHEGPPEKNVELPTPIRQPARSARVQIMAGVDLTSFALQPPLVGGEASLQVLLPRPLYFRVGGGAAGARRQYEAGEVDLLLISLRGEMGARMAFDTAGFGAGLGYRFGHARLNGRAATADQRGSVVGGLWGGPYATLFSDLRVSPPLTFRVGAEVGKVITHVRGTVSDQEDVAIVGVWGSLSFLVGAAF